MTRVSLVFLLVLAVALCTNDASGAVEYQVRDLGTLPGRTISLAFGINQRGQVVGLSSISGGPSATLWLTDGTIVELNEPAIATGASANEINNQGQAVGFAGLAVLWLPDGTPVVLPKLSPDVIHSEAFNINNSGYIVGDSQIGNRSFATIWHLDENVFGIAEGSATDISDSGRVVGYTLDAEGTRHAFLWHPQSEAFLLPDNGYSEAHGINNSGQVVGYAPFPDSGGAVLWTNKHEVVELGKLIGQFYSTALDINDSGDVVGFYEGGGGGDHAVLWTKKHEVVHLPELPGHVASAAYAINNRRQVVGYSADSDNVRHAVIWEPVHSGIRSDIDGSGTLIDDARPKRN